MNPRLILVSVFAGLLAACASVPTPDIHRGVDNKGAVAPLPGAQTMPLPSADAPETGPQAVIRRGSGRMINREVAAAPRPGLSAATTGAATFNFEGESVHAVVKAILGDMLGQNYIIAPEVQGTVTLGTPKPVSPSEALSLLEMVLSWNNARLLYSNGRYSVVPADRALAAGNIAPTTGPPASARGYEVRVVPLQYISASEMQEVLEPYASANAIVGIDSSRNLITLAGTRSELENYLRTIEIFDVDWLQGMSVGVFPLESGRATKVVADLEKVFGDESDTPSAGMFRFMPLEGANAVLVITPQPAYLDDIQDWLERIDGAGQDRRLFSHELKFIKAKDLAEQLAQVFGAPARGDYEAEEGEFPLMPGTDPVQIRDPGLDRDNGSMDFGGIGGGASGGGGLGQGSLSLNPRDGGNAAVTLEVEGDRVSVAAVEETNTLLVRASASAWRQIREVIEQLDNMPMQVHIEAQVAEVALTGDLSYGVNWFFERAVTDAGLPSAAGRDSWSTLAGNVTGTLTGAGPAGLGWTFLGRNAAAIISALDEVTNVRLLQTPSIFVRNNAEATLNVGSRIPVASVTVNPVVGSDATFSQVQYLETGIILKVRPRISKDGMVFLDIVQEVSTPGDIPDQFGNVRINTRRVKTEAAVQAGDTVMLAGLISDGVSRGSAGFPGLSRLPIVGGLFGRQTMASDRSEVIVLLTPTLVRNPQEARNLTDEYGQRFRALEPLRAPPRK